MSKTSPEAKKAWAQANKEKCRVYALRYKAKKAGKELPPEILEKVAQWEAEKEAQRAEAKARRKVAAKAYRDAYKATKKERYKERYHSDPEFREKQLAKRRRQYLQRIEKLGLKTDAEEVKRRRREQMAKARKIRNAQQHAEAVAKAEKLTKPKEYVNTHKAIQEMKRKPGRLCALMGWGGYKL